MAESLLGGICDGVILVTTDSLNYNKTMKELFVELKDMLKNNGLYVSFTAPYEVLQDSLRAKGIPTENLVFIDVLSRKPKKDAKDIKNCLFAKGAESLTEVSILIQEAIEKRDIHFIFIDNISALLSYNDLQSTERFAHYLISKMKSLKLCSIVMALEEQESKQLISRITPFCERRLNC